MGARVSGLEEAQRELQRMLAAVDPGDGLGNAIQLGLVQLHRYATGIVHVDTGRLKNSLFWEMAGDATGYVATNVAYGIHEERRGGEHAFFRRTVAEEGPSVQNFVFGVVRGR